MSPPDVSAVLVIVLLMMLRLGLPVLGIVLLGGLARRAQMIMP